MGKGREGKKTNRTRISITYTVLIITGLLLAVAGAVVAILGLGGVVEFKGEVAGAKAETTSVGLAVLVVGALLAGIVAVKLPTQVNVLGNGGRRGFTEWFSEFGVRLCALLVAAGVVLLIVSLFV
ncbi:hypothetical protein DI270_021145 [Microbispora triticiradicis]|uniref:Uncharacterized protein n=1 Tax=Microbispora triticiradicis TaxID=2200763 RepID=A0ABX9LHD0_9ACTN|nr:hypothetical protein [Microbispora triticiradicis]RGA03043.1 hypothetical protein DI270_021145 [Microbispora triticiradicis]